MKTLYKLTREMVLKSKLWAKPLPFRASLAQGHPRVLLVAGENCSGKSLVVQILQSWAKKNENTSPINVSIRERTGAGTFETAGIRRTMMFGDDSEQSTGAASARVVETAFANVAGRAESGHSALLMLDEPELGLSEGYARALGHYIGQQAQEMPELACGVIVVTHSRPLAQALQEALGVPPTFLLMEAQPDTPLSHQVEENQEMFQHWLDTPEVRTVEELLGLRKLNHERWRAVDKALAELKKA